ncbi:hypothetical protein CRYUN_Cryun23aG0118100 [Craigia yunnanensis]
MGTPMLPQSQPPSSSSNDQFNMASHKNNPYLAISPVLSSRRTPMGRICDALNRCGKKVEDARRKAEALAENVWNNLSLYMYVILVLTCNLICLKAVRVSPSLADAAVARLAQGTKLLAGGGHDRLFQQTFQILLGEKLLHAYVCYLSTSSGPVIGTLYISNNRIAFCSDYPLCYYPSPGYQQWMYYKMAVELDKLATVHPSSNRLKPSEKYIHIVTRDGYEFWLIGFISYDKARKSLTEALQHSRHASIPF